MGKQADNHDRLKRIAKDLTKNLCNSVPNLKSTYIHKNKKGQS